MLLTLSRLFTARLVGPAVRVTPAGVVALVLAAHFVLHALPQDIGTRDDADQFVFAQQFALGQHEQPPLYAWLVWAAFRLTGPSLVMYAAVKTLVLAVVAAAAWALAKEAIADPRWRRAAAAGGVLLAGPAWHAFTYLTHSNLLVAACYATAAVALRLGRLGRTRDYVLLGVVAGLGALTKYNYAHFAAALIAAGLTLPAYRARLFDRRIGLTVLIAVGIFLPHAVWLAGHWDDVWPALTGKIDAAANRGGFGRTAAALGQLPLNLLLDVLPFLLVAWWAAPEIFRRPAADDAGNLLGRTAAVALLMLTALAVGGAGRMHERWLVPVVALVPFVAFGRATGSPRRAERAVLAFALILIVARAGQVATGGGAPFRATDAAALDAVAAAAGPGGLIVAESRDLAGALAYRFPDRRVVCEDLPAYRPWPTDRGVRVWMFAPDRHALAVWSPAPRSPYKLLWLNYLPFGPPPD